MQTTSLNHAASGGGIRSPLWWLAILAFCLISILCPTSGHSQDRSIIVADADAAPAGSAAQLDAVQRAFQEVIEQVSPAVVSIRVKRKCLQLGSTGDNGEKAATTQTVLVNGSGTIISDAGAILTNEHVVQGATRIDVTFHDGRSESAEVIATDARADLAVLRTRRHDLPAIRICNWSSVARGQWTIAIGNPYGLGADGHACVSVGVISNLSRRLPGLGEQDDRQYQDMLQTTAVINPGNSGGPLFNLRGELVGVVTAMHTRAAADQGIGFAIPMSLSRVRRIEELLAGRQPNYGYIGATVREPTPDERRGSGLDAGGALVETIEPGGPADVAGLREGDTLLEAGGDHIGSAARLSEIIGDAHIGEPLQLTLKRDGREIDLPVVVQARQMDRVATLRGGAILWRGLRVAPAGEAERARQEPGVVIVEVMRDSPAERAGLKVGECIERAAASDFSGLSGFRRAVRERTGDVELYVRGRGAVRIGP